MYGSIKMIKEPASLSRSAVFTQCTWRHTKYFLNRFRFCFLTFSIFYFKFVLQLWTLTDWTSNGVSQLLLWIFQPVLYKSTRPTERALSVSTRQTSMFSRRFKWAMDLSRPGVLAVSHFQQYFQTPFAAEHERRKIRVL